MEKRLVPIFTAALVLVIVCALVGCGRSEKGNRDTSASVVCSSVPNQTPSDEETQDSAPINSASNTEIIPSAIWENLGKGQSTFTMMYGYPGISVTANDAIATYSQIDSFLSQSVPYTGEVPKDGTEPYIEHAGYLGPPVLTISDTLHTVVINPAWYVETPGGGNFSVHQVPDVLEVSVDDQTTYIQSKEFYDWMYNMQWQSSFGD
ncbi:MAG: hypothetical protein FWC62_06240 [Firmicutes bacterium]|nr:hypothetical protein [Bacillota bacterium]